MSRYSFGQGIPTWNGIPMLGEGIPMFTGNRYFVDPVNGSDGNTGKSSSKPFKTLYKAHAACTDGNNDVVYLIGNGAASGSARLSIAGAQLVDSTATAGTLLWTKSATHLVGVGAPTRVAQRARIAPATGAAAETATVFLGTGSNIFVYVTGSGCMFSNISLFHGFGTGAAAQICWKDAGQRNFYANVDFGGIADTASANSATSRSLVVGGAGLGYGEHTFVGCTVGLDTVARTAANTSLEFLGGSPRNNFIDCTFPLMNNATAGVLGISIGASAIDRWVIFDRCKFINAVGSTSTTQTNLCAINASPGGVLLFKDCALLGITGFADNLTHCYVEGGTPATASTGLAVTAAA